MEISNDIACFEIYGCWRCRSLTHRPRVFPRAKMHACAARSLRWLCDFCAAYRRCSNVQHRHTGHRDSVAYTTFLILFQLSDFAYNCVRFDYRVYVLCASNVYSYCFCQTNTVAADAVHFNIIPFFRSYCRFVLCMCVCECTLHAFGCHLIYFAIIIVYKCAMRCRLRNQFSAHMREAHARARARTLISRNVAAHTHTHTLAGQAIRSMWETQSDIVVSLIFFFFFVFVLSDEMHKVQYDSYIYIIKRVREAAAGRVRFLLLYAPCLPCMSIVSRRRPCLPLRGWLPWDVLLYFATFRCPFVAKLNARK